jgi:subtilisin family serine protease
MVQHVVSILTGFRGCRTGVVIGLAWLVAGAGILKAQQQAGTALTANEIRAGMRVDRFIVKPAQGLLRERRDNNKPLAVRARVAQESGLTEKWKARMESPDTAGGGPEVVHLEGGANLEEAIQEFSASGLYDYVEPDYLYYPSAVPNDPRYAAAEQWGMHNTGQSAGVADADIDAPEAWDTRTSAAEVLVAVIDSGVRYTHEDLASNMWINPGEIAGNGLDDDRNGYIDDVHGINAITGSGDPMDDSGHGTHVAGIVGAVGNNGKGVAGTAWQVKLMALKFLDSGGGSTSDAIKCLTYARSYSQGLLDAINACRQNGMIFVASAGNGSSDTGLVTSYPSGYALDNILTVASSTRRDVLAASSNFGLNTVDLAAPGDSVMSCIHSSDSAYGIKSGSSMAAPHVSGALALLKSQFPADNYRGLMNRVLRSTDRPPGLAGKTQTSGRLNLQAALTSTLNTPFNDSFAAAAALAGGSVTVRSSNRLATTETGEPLHAGVPGSANTLWWKWTAPSGGGLFSVNLAGSDFDTLVGIYTGTALTNLTEVAGNDNSSSTVTTSRAVFTATGGTQYYIGVAGKTAAASGLVRLQISESPVNDSFERATIIPATTKTVTGTLVSASRQDGEPQHAGQPGGASVWWVWTAPSNRQVTLRVEGSGINTLLAVYTGRTLGSLVPIVSNDDWLGSSLRSEVSFIAQPDEIYYIAVDAKTAATGPITLTLAAPPRNDNFASRDSLPVMVNFYTEDDLALSTRETGEPVHTLSGNGGTIWWEWSPPVSQAIRIHNIGSVAAGDLAIYTGMAVDALTPVATTRTPVGNGWSSHEFFANAGTNYQIVMEGSASNLISATAMELHFTPLPPAVQNDLFASRVTINGLSAVVTGNGYTATVEPGEPQLQPSLWWTWTAPSNGTGRAELSTYGSAYDTTLHVYTGSTLSSLIPVASNDDADERFTSRVNFAPQPGQTYQIAVTGLQGATYNDNAAVLRLEMTLENAFPVVTSALLSPAGTAFSDEPVTVGPVTATDAENDPFTLVYQWQKSSNGTTYTDEPGASAATLAPDADHGGLLWRCAVRGFTAAGTGLPFFTAPVRLTSRPVTSAHHGSAYTYESRLYFPLTQVNFERSAVINEFSQGNVSGENREWVEILLLKDSDLRGWTIRDSSGTAITTLSAAAGSVWTNVPAGTLAVIYNAAQRDPVLPPDDTTLLDGNFRLIVSSNQASVTSGAWPLLGNTSDDIAVRTADGTLVDGVSYGGKTTYAPALGTVGSRTSAYYSGGLADVPEDLIRWGTQSAGNASPASANPGSNQTFVAGLRSGIYRETPRYQLAANSDTVPGLTLDPVSGVLSGTPEVLEGGLFQVVIQKGTSAQSTNQTYSLLIASANGVYPIPENRTWTLTGPVTLEGSLKVVGSINQQGFPLLLKPTFDSWMALHEITGPPHADPDGDGFSLFAEFAHDLNPHAMDNPFPVWVEDGYLFTSVRWQKAPSNLNYGMEVSSGLQTWSPLDSSLQAGPAVSAGLDSEILTFRVPVSNSGPIYLRSKAESSP